MRNDDKSLDRKEQFRLDQGISPEQEQNNKWHSTDTQTSCWKIVFIE